MGGLKTREGGGGEDGVRLTSPAGGRAGGRADVAATCADAASQEPGHAGGRADVAATGARRGRTRAAAHQLVRSA